MKHLHKTLSDFGKLGCSVVEQGNLVGVQAGAAPGQFRIANPFHCFDGSRIFVIGIECLLHQAQVQRINKNRDGSGWIDLRQHLDNHLLDWELIGLDLLEKNLSGNGNCQLNCNLVDNSRCLTATRRELIKALAQAFQQPGNDFRFSGFRSLFCWR